MSAAVSTGSAVVVDARCFHARPAVRMSRLAKQFMSDVKLRPSGADWINAKSTSALMKMKVTDGAVVKVRAQGEDCDQAVRAVVDLIKRRFGE